MHAIIFSTSTTMKIEKDIGKFILRRGSLRHLFYSKGYTRVKRLINADPNHGFHM